MVGTLAVEQPFTMLGHLEIGKLKLQYSMRALIEQRRGGVAKRKDFKLQETICRKILGLHKGFVDLLLNHRTFSDFIQHTCLLWRLQEPQKHGRQQGEANTSHYIDQLGATLRPFMVKPTHGSIDYLEGKALQYYAVGGLSVNRNSPQSHN